MKCGFFYLFIFFLFSPTLLFSQQKESPQIGLVLEGGGALGLAHIGVIQVLEELGVPIDRIGGTSMGGLVGGLHAIGYSPSQLEEIAMEMDWSVMIGNDIDRAQAPFAIKNESERFLLSVSRDGANVTFEGALVDGTNIYQKLQELCAPALGIRDFEKLSTPFFCIAADLEIEDQVVFDKGYLPDVLRATMSIPVLFNPVRMDGMLLVDGGLLNNFPVREMREKGADFVIGVRLIMVDSSEQSYGLFDLIGRTYEVVMDKVRCEYEYDPDLLIDVILPGLDASDFDRAEDFIKYGRQAAEKKIEELKKISDENYIKKEKLFFEESNFVLHDIVLEGEGRLNETKIKKILQLPLEEEILFSDIQNATEKLQATNLFETIRYQINEENNRQTLRIYVKEKSSEFFNIGLRYDNNFGPSLLLNSTFRNIFKGGDFASIDLRLNRSSYFSGEYIYHALREYSPFISSSLKGYDFFNYFSENDFEIFQHNQLEIRGGLIWTPTNYFQLRVGGEWQFYGFDESADHLIFDLLNKHLLNYFVDISIDEANRSNHPTEGFRSYFFAKRISSMTDSKSEGWLTFAHEQYIPVINKVTATLTGQVGLSTGFIDRQFLFYQGGLYNHLRPALVPQPGIRLMEFNAENILSLGAGLDMEIYRTHHVVAGLGMSTLNNNASGLFSGKWRQGIYAGYHTSTIVGPLNFRIGFPLDDFNAQVFISAGHFF